MRNKFKRLAAGLLSVVLAMTVLLPFALAVNCDGDEGIAPHSVRCPNCGELARVSTTWLDSIVGQYDETCIHKPHGTDTWGYRYGQSLEECTNCGWYEVSTLSQRMLVKCYGSF